MKTNYLVEKLFKFQEEYSMLQCKVSMHTKGPFQSRSSAGGKGN